MAVWPVANGTPPSEMSAVTSTGRGVMSVSRMLKLSLVNASLEFSTLTVARTVAGASWAGTAVVTVIGGSADPAAMPPECEHSGVVTSDGVQVQPVPAATAPLNTTG